MPNDRLQKMAEFQGELFEKDVASVFKKLKVLSNIRQLLMG